MSVSFTDHRQVINMGGPWVATLDWNKKVNVDDVLIDSLYDDIPNSRKFFNRYHAPTKWAKDSYFTVCYIELASDSVFEINKRFPSSGIPKFKIDSSNKQIISVTYPDHQFFINIDEVDLLSFNHAN